MAGNKNTTMETHFDLSLKQIQIAFSKLPDANKDHAGNEYILPVMENIRSSPDNTVPDEVTFHKLRFVKKPFLNGYSYYLRIE